MKPINQCQRILSPISRYLPYLKVDVCGLTDGCKAPAPFEKMESALNDITYCYNFFVFCPDEGDTWMLTPSWQNLSSCVC